MPKLVWDEQSKHFFETGVDHGVWYGLDEENKYTKAEAWDGLTSVSESPSGADANDQYADNIKYLTIRAAETFGGTIEAFSSPEGFKECDGRANLATGVTVAQQTRKTFGFAYRTRLGNDIAGTDYGYIIHLVYGATVSPSSKQYSSIGESPEPITLSWEFSTTPVNVEGFKPTSMVEVNSTKVSAEALTKLENALYGTDSQAAYLPLPDEVKALIAA